MLKPPAYKSRHYWGVEDQPAFEGHVDAMLETLKYKQGIYASDNLISFGRTLGFVDDAVLIKAWQTHATYDHERAILWRTATVAWAVRQALRLEGDFVECGAYRGTTARIILDLVDLSARRFFLYDAFRDIEGRKSLPGMGEDLERECRGRFTDFPNVVITTGLVPASFAQVLPEKVAFAHIDMNNADAEIGALEGLAERFTPGAVILLDDYGWLPYRPQHVAEKAWFAERGRQVLEMPTGQGLVIW